MANLWIFQHLGALCNTRTYGFFAYLSNITNVANCMFIEKVYIFKYIWPCLCYALFNPGWKNKFTLFDGTTRIDGFCALFASCYPTRLRIETAMCVFVQNSSSIYLEIWKGIIANLLQFIMVR